MVGASSGALNGVFCAAAVRSGSKTWGKELETLWAEKASLFEIFDPNLLGMATFTGALDQDRLLALLERRVPRTGGQPAAGVTLCMSVTALNGVDGAVVGSPHTTFEHVFSFTDGDFELRRPEILKATMASAAFPWMFQPVTFEDQPRVQRAGDTAPLGPCIDGGAVNNTPLKYALADPSITKVIVVTPYPAIAPALPEITFPSLTSRVVSLLIHERLYRDLKEAEDVNDQLRAIDALACQGFNAEDVTQIRSALGWSNRRVVKIVAMRPDAPLPGNEFEGFVVRRLREQHIEVGKQVAARVLR